MAEPRTSQNAARLSEDIGDVLSAIRRMIADDQALSTARDRIRAGRSGAVQDDAGEFLARRYGGNAALARKLVESTARPAADAAAPAPAPTADPASTVPPFVLRPRLQVMPGAGGAPLRLEGERRVEDAEPSESPRPSGWRAWLRAEVRETAVPVVAEPAPGADCAAAPRIDDGADDGDDFAEAFDWKARMRPEPPVPAAAAEPKAAEARLSGWAQSPEAVEFDPVAHLAAEAEAFDAELQAQQSAPEENDQDIRDLLREMVQQELNGELGQRFSANLRAVIRREVAAAIDAQLDRF